MDLNFKTVMYVVMGIVYLIFQARKNAAKKRKQREQQASEPVVEQSYEVQNERPREVYEPAQPEESSSLEDLMEQYFPPTQKQPEKKVVVKQQDLKAYEEVSVKEDLVEEDEHMDHFDAYEHEIEYRSKWARMLQTSDGAQDAFVASEIFNKKY